MSINVKKYTINFDGACIPRNPGGVGIASWVIRDDEGKLVEVGAEEVCRGDGSTNNVAEYAGLVLGLRALQKHHTGPIAVRGDSELVVKQINGEYKVKSEVLRGWWVEALAELAKFDHWTVKFVPRNQNQEADKAGKDKYKQLEGK